MNCDAEHSEKIEKEASVVVKSTQNATKPGLAEYGSSLKDIIVNLPSELKSFGSIPCAQRSLYTGILAGGIVSAAALIVSGTGGNGATVGIISM